MESTKIKNSIANLGKALQRLDEALAIKEPNEITIDGSIQRFEFCIELLWKCIRRILVSEGIETKTPKETMRQAFHVGWLKNEETWLALLNARNQSSHLYDHEISREVYEKVKKHFPEMKSLYEDLKQRVESQA